MGTMDHHWKYCYFYSNSLPGIEKAGCEIINFCSYDSQFYARNNDSTTPYYDLKIVIPLLIFL